MNPTRQSVALLGVVAGVLLTILLIVWPGWLLNPAPPIRYQETVALGSAPCPVSGPIPPTLMGMFSFHTVTFHFWFESTGCGVLGTWNATGAEQDGVSYAFQFAGLGGPNLGKSFAWTSPDRIFGFFWPSHNIVLVGQTQSVTIFVQ